MKKKNILCIIAALISCTAIFCSCGATSERSESSETAAVSETSAVTESESISDVDLSVPTAGATEVCSTSHGARKTAPLKTEECSLSSTRTKRTTVCLIRVRNTVQRIFTAMADMKSE